MTRVVSPRAWLTAGLAALLLLLGPAGHAQVAADRGRAAVQAAITHDGVVVAPTTRVAAGRTAALDATIVDPAGPARTGAPSQTTTPLVPATQAGTHAASARAPPLKD